MATTYLENQETDAFGNMVRDTRGGAAAMQMFRQYDPLTGHLSEICAGSDTVSCQIMRDRYVWDSVGNLNWRDRKDYGEDFWYDSVDRLQVSRLNRAGGTTYAYGSGQITDWADYDKLGNVCAHWMRGSQSMGYFYAGRTGCGLNGSLGGTYNSSLTDSPHQVRQTSAYSSFVYDSHGNQTFADSATSDSLDRTIRYNAQDQAYEILKGPVAAPSRTARFWYDPSGSRYKREDTGVGIVGTRRTLYVGNLEIVSENGTTTYKRYIGGVLVQNVVNGIAANRYLFQDHLGSTVAVTNEAGTFIEGGGFNAFGERRTNGSATGITTTGLSATTRGFTGHEMLDDGLDVIHMNGRIYDPTLGRFLQADPVIQNTSTPQAWNAYTYVFNNPYRYTDPTGMIGVEERQWLAMAVTIAATWYAPQVWGAAYAAAGGAAAGATAAAAANAAVVGFTVATGAVAGGISGGSNGAVMGAFSALAFYGIGQAFSGMQGAAGTGFLGSGFTSGEFAAKVLAHGIAGGVMVELQGGKFGNGFVSAAGAELASPYIDSIGGGQASYAGARVAVAALVGGTLSALTGGKFASGALTAAFSRAFNRELHDPKGRWKASQRASERNVVLVRSGRAAGESLDGPSDTLYPFDAYVIDGNGAYIAGPYEASVFYDPSRAACTGAGVNCPTIAPGAYAYIRFRAPGGWGRSGYVGLLLNNGSAVPTLAPNTSRNVIGTAAYNTYTASRVYLHPGAVFDTTSEGCLTIVRTQYKSFISNFPGGSHGYVLVPDWAD